MPEYWSSIKMDKDAASDETEIPFDQKDLFSKSQDLKQGNKPMTEEFFLIQASCGLDESEDVMILDWIYGIS